ncbi:hypothetical protein [Constantimarinum furrinae]|uniref:Uncharacterized protein n=1 Tax=Constantimarinum furrinae TaxID=2562285 RepID=A0A7G8PU26_9FLAO|nr:hypothetical protein [Constantimarinum furrinae]QNJ97842.1 hypothetical protein ALE3EI_1277 [Constantimarinum furrinae]
MKKNIVILTVIIIGSLSSITAQHFDTPYGTRQFTNDLYQLDEYIKRQDQGINYDDTDSYRGTPYNTPSYLPGNVYNGSDLLATNVALRYNAMADEIEIKESVTTPDDEAKVLTKSPDIFVKINNKDIFVFAPYKGGIEGGGYFQILHEGDRYDLFKKHVKEFTPAKTASTSITRDTPAKFKDRPVYYIVTKDGKFYELPTSRNKKLKVFGENQDLVKDYVSQNQLDLNEENDLVRVIKYYNTIGKR